MKTLTAVILTTVLAALVYAANFGFWLDRNVIDAEEFVKSAQEALALETSRTAASELIVGQMVDEFPLLIVLEANLIDLFSELLATDALAEVITVVSIDLHEHIVTGDRRAVIISLDEFRHALIGPLEVVSPRIADLVPEDWFVSVEVVEADTLPDLSVYVEWGGVLKLVSILGALAAAGVMMWLVSPRSVAVALVGVSFVIAAMATAILVPGARWFAVQGVESGSMEVLIGNTYTTFTHGLLVSSGVMAVIGVTLVVFGTVLFAGERDMDRGTGARPS